MTVLKSIENQSNLVEVFEYKTFYMTVVTSKKDYKRKEYFAPKTNYHLEMLMLKKSVTGLITVAKDFDANYQEVPQIPLTVNTDNKTANPVEAVGVVASEGEALFTYSCSRCGGLSHEKAPIGSICNMCVWDKELEGEALSDVCKDCGVIAPLVGCGTQCKECHDYDEKLNQKRMANEVKRNKAQELIDKFPTLMVASQLPNPSNPYYRSYPKHPKETEFLQDDDSWGDFPPCYVGRGVYP